MEKTIWFAAVGRNAETSSWLVPLGQTIAGVAVALGDGEHGAVVLPDQKRAVGFGGEVGQVAILIENLRGFGDTLDEGESAHPRFRPFEAAIGAAGTLGMAALT